MSRDLMFDTKYSSFGGIAGLYARCEMRSTTNAHWMFSADQIRCAEFFVILNFAPQMEIFCQIKMARKSLAPILIDLVGYILEKISDILNIFFFHLNLYSKDF